MAKAGPSCENEHKLPGVYTNYQSAKIPPNAYNQDHSCSFSINISFPNKVQLISGYTFRSHTM